MKNEKSLEKILDEQERKLLKGEAYLEKINKYDKQILNSLYPHIIFVGGILVGFLLNLLASALDRTLSAQSWYSVYLVFLCIISIAAILFIIKILPFENILVSLNIRRTKSSIKNARRAIEWGRSVIRDMESLEGSEPASRKAILRIAGLYYKFKLKKIIKKALKFT